MMAAGLRALMALALLFALLPLPTASGASEISVKLVSLSGESVKLGQALKFKVVIDNDTPESEFVSVGLSIAPAGAPDEIIAFDRWAGSVLKGRSMVVTRSVTTGQWFPKRGSFVITTTSDDAEPDQLAFDVKRPPRKVPRFQDVTEGSGLTTQHQAFIVCDDYSAGAAWADIDGDGDLDLYLPHQDAPAQLFVNEGGSFVDQAMARGVDNGTSIGIAAVFADYDNDGDSDLYVINDGPNRLYANDGSGHFSDVTSIAGVGDPYPGSSASWGDYDNDGHLDLFVVNWARCIKQGSYTYSPDTLYHNNGDGTFTEVTDLLPDTVPSDPAQPPYDPKLGAGFQSSWFDYDRDGDQDLYLGNDYGGPAPKPNALWRNDGPGEDGSWTFTNVSIASGMALAMNTMGIGIGDYDRDLDFDVALSNILASKLMRNNGDGTFTNVAESVGSARRLQKAKDASITWGLNFADFNNDGWEDLYVGGGAIEQEDRLTPQSNQLFVNDGGVFLDHSAPSRADDDGITRGVAFADYDRDGRMDLYVVNQYGFPKLFRNTTGPGSTHWLEIDTVGRGAPGGSNRDGCGTVVIAKLNRETKLLREVFCGSVSLGAGSDSTLHFGLGDATKVKLLTIKWPSGITQRLKNVSGDRLKTITEPQA